MMSKHIGAVYSAERNDKSPGIIVDVSSGGVELHCDPTFTLRPIDARVLASLLNVAAAEADRMTYPLVERLTNAIKALHEAAVTGQSAHFAGILSAVVRDLELNTDVQKSVK